VRIHCGRFSGRVAVANSIGGTSEFGAIAQAVANVASKTVSRSSQGIVLNCVQPRSEQKLPPVELIQSLITRFGMLALFENSTDLAKLAQVASDRLRAIATTLI